MLELSCRQLNLDDECCKAVSELAPLEWLDVQSAPQVTDAGLAHLAKLPRLRYLWFMDAPRTTDAGMEHLAGLENLAFLTLAAPQITDAELAQLARLKSLKHLNLGIAATESGVADFKRALPGCLVDFPRGVPWQR